jgi:hypothetical protein
LENDSDDEKDDDYPSRSQPATDTDDEDVSLSDNLSDSLSDSLSDKKPAANNSTDINEGNTDNIVHYEDFEFENMFCDNNKDLRTWKKLLMKLLCLKYRMISN